MAVEIIEVRPTKAWNSTLSGPKKPMKRTQFKRKSYTPLKRSKLRLQGVSSASVAKREIQALVRQIVILRDQGCILDPTKANSLYFQSTRSIGLNPLHVPPCNGYAKDGHLILQADHLLSRSHSATYGDTRLIVCVCKGHHGWKSVGNNLRKEIYDKLVRQILSPQRIALWDMAEATKHKPVKMDWQLVKVALQAELKALQKL